MLLADAQDRFAPSTWQRIDLGALHARALHLAQNMTDACGEPRLLPEVPPLVLGDLLSVRPDLVELEARLGSQPE